MTLMPQSLSALYVHVVFSTKGRQPLLHDDRSADVHSYLAGIAKRLGCEPISVNGMPDHVHLLLRLARTTSVSDLVRDLKSNSSSWIRQRQGTFAWQNGYGAFSVGQTELPKVKQYVEGQAKHHAKTTYQDEFLALLREHGLEWDDRFVWD